MAGERKGSIYEAFIMVTLRILKRQGKIKDNIFWNEKPKGMSIEPDFTIGTDVDHPNFVLLVTHSGAANNSNMKFWRNIGELYETKILLSTIPKTLSVVFDSIIKESLKKLQATAFDGQIIIGDKSYGTALRKWVDANYLDFPVNKLEKVTYIESLSSKDVLLTQLIEKLVVDMEGLLSSLSPDLDSLWHLERIRSSRLEIRDLKVKNTFLRRGVSKLLIFENINTALELYRGKKVRANQIPNYIYELGLAQKGIGSAKAADDEIVNLVNLLSDDQIRMIVDSAPMSDIDNLISILRNIEHLKFMGEFTVSEYDNLCDYRNLSKWLIELHENPWALVDPTVVPHNWPPKSVWILEYILELIKLSTGSANGYGHLQMAREVIDAGWGTNEDLSSAAQFGGGFGFSAWIARKKSLFRDDLIEGIAYVLASRLSNITKLSIINFVKKLPEAMTRNIIEYKLCTYPAFDPIFTLIKGTLPDSQRVNIRSAFAEKAGVTGQSGTTTVIMVKNTIINWQSTSDAGRDHKKKELCGRAITLRYTWDATANKFILRPNVKKLILLLDGTWRQRDIATLIRAGWDEIFYPDEMDEFVKAII